MDNPRLKSLKIAFFFKNNSYIELYNDLKRKLNLDLIDLRIHYCHDLKSLIDFSPEIVVAHESCDLNNYLISKPDNLRWLNLMSSGVDKVINLLNSKNIVPGYVVTNTKGVHGEAISEYVIASILFFEKNINRLNLNKKEREWARFPLNIVSGKKAIIYGAGEVGNAVASKLNVLGVSVSGVSLNARFNDNFNQMYNLSDSIKKLGNFDYVINCMPLTKITRGFFNSEIFKLFKKNCVFVNISRGEIVDEEALIVALSDGTLKAAAVDAFKVEPLPPESRFWELENLLLTPHVSGLFPEGKRMGVNLFLDNLTRYIKAERLSNVVYLDREY